ncbi:MAG: hypothetical protein HGA37_12870, partial [Lentimicrobium sp.]|nr:hypothetical protein [Lentimicrobium sp.]
AGCKIKDKNQESNPKLSDEKESIAWLLAADDFKGWAVESFSVNGEDQLKSMKPCQLDNIDFYYRNQIYESREGKSRCDDTDPEIRSRGKWTLSADSTAIEVKLGSKPYSLQIVSLTKNRLHYRSEVNNQITEVVLVATEDKPVNADSPDTNR